MNYYTFHSGDYLRDTSHLTLIEDVVRAARKAVINKGEGSKFLFVYFCGICWRQIKEDSNEGTN